MDGGALLPFQVPGLRIIVYLLLGHGLGNFLFYFQTRRSSPPVRYIPVVETYFIKTFSLYTSPTVLRFVAGTYHLPYS